MNTSDAERTGPDREDRTPNQDEPKDTDRVVERTESPPGESMATGFDTDAPGNFVDDESSAEVPEPNEPG